MTLRLLPILLLLLTSLYSQLTAATPTAGRVAATQFSIDDGFYLDQEKWLAVDPLHRFRGVARVVFPYRDGVYDVTLEMVGENDGQSTFEVQIERETLGTLTAPTTTETFATGPKFDAGWKKVKIHDGDIVRVSGVIDSADGKEWSRARWVALRFTPVDGGAALEPVDTTTIATAASKLALFGARHPDGDGSVELSGELRTWHNAILTLDGPFAHEQDNAPNPFIDRQMNVTFTHSSGTPSYTVPAYFAADGNAGETSAEAGTKWRAHLSPDKTGKWDYQIDFKGTDYDGTAGSFEVSKSNKTGRDFRAKGRLQYVNERYLQFAESGEWFLKVGADAPETLLGYTDFDGTTANNPKKCPLKTWAPHEQDWSPGDPTWQNGKGKGLIGAVNYLSNKGVNAFSFLTYNAGGDGDNVWPHLSRDDKRHFDCSKLDQWDIVFSHGTAQGMFLHFKLQETENDDLQGSGKDQALDDGELGIERKVYLRELIARFGHNLALNWNIGEENTQNFQQCADMVRYIRATDPYAHLIVLHTYPDQKEKRYNDHLGQADLLTGLSLQNSNVSDSHRQTLKWVAESATSGHPWVVAFDEAGNAGAGTPPDPDWPGMAEAVAKIDQKKLKVPTIDDIRAEVLWGTLMAGGTGVEYYFGYRLPENDLNAQDWRSRDQTWDYSRIALEFFQEHQIPMVKMHNANALVGNTENNNDRYCLAQRDQIYLVYLRQATATTLDLSDATGNYQVQWFNPRTGGHLQSGSVTQVTGGSIVDLGIAPSDPEEDWVVLIQKGK